MTGMHTFPLGVHKLTTSAYSPSGNGGVERVFTPRQKYKPWSATNTNMTGMHTFSTSNTLSMTLLAR